MEELERKIGYAFRDGSLLKSALAHSSYANENRGAGVVSNERLEFLGDSVLGFVTAEYLYRSHPDMPEGGMTKLRAELVCEQSLHRVAQELELGKYIRLGKGEEHTGGRTRPSILADAVEAVIADALPGMYEENRGVFLDVPQYLGVEELAGSGVVLKFIVSATEENIFAARRALNRSLKLLFDEKGIDIPYPQLTVHTK